MEMDNLNPEKIKRRTLTAVLELKNVKIVEKMMRPCTQLQF